ncbi:MAG: LamG domain-containing protein [Candidatus Doudnabacteria bacterium]
MPRFLKILLFIIIAAGVAIGSVLTIRAVNNRGAAPVGWWKMDEGQGQTTYDASGNGNNGTLGASTSDTTPDPTWKNEESCKNGKCLQFDGSNDYVNAGNTGTHLPSITVSAWIKPNTVGDGVTWASDGIVNKYTTATYYGWKLGLDSSGYVTWVYISAVGGSCLTDVLTDSKSLVGSWHHVVGVRSSAGLILYVDGVQVGSRSVTCATESNNEIINIGGPRVGGGSGEYFNGTIDDVRVYNYARSANQIKADYNRSAGGKGAGVKVGSSQEEQNASDGLVGYWKMDEASGNPVDSSGNGSTLTNTGTATFASGKFGNTASLNGSSQYFYVADNAILSLTGDVVLSAWIYADSITGSHDIVGKWDGANESYLLSLEGDELRMWADSVLNYKTTDAANLAISTWYFVTGVYDASEGKVRLYVNGTEQAGTITGTIPTSIGDTGDRLQIGAEDSTGGAANYFDGYIDDVKIYNKARSAEQIRRDYESGPSPVAHWKMDENSGQYAYDTSGTNNGTLGTDATANASDPQWTNGKYGNALKFDGTDDYVKCGDTNLPAGASARTVGFWTKRAVSTNFAVGPYPFFYGTKTQYQGFGLYGNSGTTDIYFYGHAYDFDTGINLDDTLWHHIVLTFDGTNLGAYKDGVLISTTNRSLLNTVLSAFDFTIGGFYVADQYWNGLIDDVRIYNYARTQKQIMEDMNAGHPAIGSPVGSYALYLPFDEGYGDTTYDKSVNKNSGDLYGSCPGAATCPTWTTAGKFGKALSFDGGDYVTVADSAVFNAESFAVCAWVRPASFSNYQNILAKQRGGDTFEQFGLLVNSSGGVGFQLGNGGTDFLGPLTLNTWAHVCGSTDGTTGTLYINGRSLGSGGDNATYGASKPFYIGYTQYGSGRYFNGLIDEVKFYPFDLSPAEIKEEFNRGSSLKLGASGTESDGITPSNSAASAYCVPGDATSCAAPVAHWKMDEKADNTCSGGVNDVCDTSGNANDGANTGGPVWKSAASCHSGSCLSFDGSNDYVDAGSNVYNFNGAFTLSLWFKQSALTSDKTMLSNWRLANVGGVSSHGLFLERGTSPTTLRFVYRNNGVDTMTMSQTTDYSANVWHHVVVSYDPSLASANGKMFLDGVQMSVTANATSIFAITGRPLVIGSLSPTEGGYERFFNGSIDDVRIYNYARTPAQIAWEYNRGGPVASWSMDSVGVSASPGTALNVYDSSGKANTGVSSGETMNNGTLTGGPTWKDGSNCKYGSCLSFDGADDYVSSPFTNGFSSTFSTSFWVNFNNFNNTYNGTIAQQISGAPQVSGWSGYYTGGVFRIFARSNSVNFLGDSGESTGFVPAVSTWYNFAITWDSTGDGKVRFYVNGTLTYTSTGLSQTPMTGLPKLLMGALQWKDINQNSLFSDQELNGKLDDVRIYNTALTATQVAALYNNNDRAAGASLEANLVGEWRLDENASLYAADTHYQRNGKYGYAMNFDGSNDWVNIGHPVSLNFANNPFTLSAWFKTTADGNILRKWEPSYVGGYYLRVLSGKGVFLVHDNTPDSYTLVETTSNVNDGGWHILTGIYDGNGVIRVYLDGKYENSANTGTVDGTTDDDLYIGSMLGAGFFNGLIDDVRIYNYALNATQIKTLFNESSAVRFGPLEGLP